MLDFIRNWIINITVVMIFIMLLETILPNSEMKRYVNVVVGFLIVIVIIQPFMLVKDISLQFNENVIETTAYMKQNTLSDHSRELSRYRKLEALELFKESIRSQILRLLEQDGFESEKTTIELEVVNEIDHKDFGQIKSIDIALNDERSSAIEVNKINVSISKVDPQDSNKSVMNKDNGEYNFNDNKLTSKIKSSISKALGVDESVIHVKAQ